MAENQDPGKLAEALLKLLQENSKPVVSRVGSNKLRVEFSGQSVEFAIAPTQEATRRDL